jgi:hypothetical protein
MQRGRGLGLTPVVGLTVLVGWLAGCSRAEAAPPLVAADPAHASPVAFSDGSTYSLYTQYGPIDVVCVAFVNHGPRAATKVGLNLAYVAADGTVLGVDPIYPTGKFPVDQRSAFSGTRGGGGLVSNGNCHDIWAVRGSTPSTFQYRMGRDAPPTVVAAVLVSAREIVYDDGTAWRTDDVPHPGDKATIPPPPPLGLAGPPIVGAQAVAGAPIDVTDAVAIGPVRRAQSTCISFKNHDVRTATRVLIALALVDRTGTVADVKTLYNSGTYSPNVNIDNSRGACLSIDGKTDGDTFLDPVDGHPDGVAIGRIIATPLHVDFADGTSWQAPNPPKAGDRVGG